jgi:pimeloyl-ACP methyl ester carboxylesterase
VYIREKVLRIVYREHELKGKVPLLVFVHGFGGQVYHLYPCLALLLILLLQIGQWTPMLTFFSQTCNILAFDMVGHGKSDFSSRFLIEST